MCISLHVFVNAPKSFWEETQENCDGSNPGRTAEDTDPGQVKEGDFFSLCVLGSGLDFYS